LGALIAVLNWAAGRRLVSRHDVPKIDIPPVTEGRLAFMTTAEAEAFHAAAMAFQKFNGRVGMFVSLGLFTGARKSAIKELTWDRVDLFQGIIDYRVPGQVVSDKRRVALPMNSVLRKIITERAANPFDFSPYVIGQGSIRLAYEAFTKSIGMEWVTPHVMRHTAATTMLSREVSIWDVSGVLGASPATITRVYGHHATHALRGAVNALNELKEGPA
jgi:integrase